MEKDEKLIFNNCFGTITDKRLILRYKSGTEDLPISKITSVSFQHERNTTISVGSFLITIICFVAMITKISRLDGIEVLLIVLFIVISLLSSIANWIGHHNIYVSVGGTDRKPIKVEMAKTKEGRDFVNALKRVII